MMVGTTAEPSAHKSDDEQGGDDLTEQEDNYAGSCPNNLENPCQTNLAVFSASYQEETSWAENLSPFTLKN